MLKLTRLTLYVLAIFVFATVAVPVAGEQSPSTDQVGVSLRELLAQKTEQLGTCQASLASFEAGVWRGTLRSPADVMTAVRSQFEKVNPGKTLDETWKSVDVPAKPPSTPKASGRGGH